MEEQYIRGAYAELIRAIKSLGNLSGGGGGSSEAILTEIATKLDTLITSQTSISSATGTIKENTDEVEDDIKNTTLAINTVKDSVERIETDTSDIATKVSDIKENSSISSTILDAIRSQLDTFFTTLQNSLRVMWGMQNPASLGEVPEGDTTFDTPSVLCNITEDNITATVIAANDVVEHTIVLTPGWNPVVVKSITGATANTLIYGN